MTKGVHTTEATFTQCYVKAFDIQQEQIHDGLEYGSIPQWDSVGHMVLVAEFERRFDITLEPEDIVTTATVGRAKAMLKKHGICLEPTL